MQKVGYRLIGVIVFFLMTHILLAQEGHSFKDSRYRVGLMYGIGTQDLLDVKYKYRAHFFKAQLYFACLQRPSLSIDLLAQPQYNLTKFRPVDETPVEERGYELGLNVGILVRKQFFDAFLSLYGCVSSGPHYVSGTPARQASGFIFSDNFFIGLNFQLYENIYLDLRSGFRHISNANFREPNSGVNNVILSAGVLMNLRG